MELSDEANLFDEAEQVQCNEMWRAITGLLLRKLDDKSTSPATPAGRPSDARGGPGVISAGAWLASPRRVPNFRRPLRRFEL
jgi:hypothetical protein